MIHFSLQLLQFGFLTLRITAGNTQLAATLVTTASPINKKEFVVPRRRSFGAAPASSGPRGTRSAEVFLNSMAGSLPTGRQASR